MEDNLIRNKSEKDDKSPKEKNYLMLYFIVSNVIEFL